MPQTLRYQDYLTLLRVLSSPQSSVICKVWTTKKRTLFITTKHFIIAEKQADASVVGMIQILDKTHKRLISFQEQYVPFPYPNMQKELCYLLSRNFKIHFFILSRTPHWRETYAKVSELRHKSYFLSFRQFLECYGGKLSLHQIRFTSLTASFLHFL